MLDERRLAFLTLPRGVLVAMALLFTARIAALTLEWRSFADGTAGRSSSVITSTIPPRSAAESAALQTVLQANLFGASPAAVAISVAQGLVLTGTFVFSDASLGYAVLGEKSDRAAFHMVGQEVLPGIVLKQVFADHVVLDRSGVLEILPMTRSPALGAGGTLYAAVQYEPPGDPELDIPPPIVMNSGIRAGSPAVQTSNN